MFLKIHWIFILINVAIINFCFTVCISCYILVLTYIVYIFLNIIIKFCDCNIYFVNDINLILEYGHICFLLLLYKYMNIHKNFFNLVTYIYIYIYLSFREWLASYLFHYKYIFLIDFFYFVKKMAFANVNYG